MIKHSHKPNQVVLFFQMGKIINLHLFIRDPVIQSKLSSNPFCLVKVMFIQIYSRYLCPTLCQFKGIITCITPNIQNFPVTKIFRDLNGDIAIIATGGRTDETIQLAIETGANAISYTPPTTAELFKEIMVKYRNQ